MPWELLEFPLLSISPMDVPWSYDSDGQPNNPKVQQAWED